MFKAREVRTALPWLHGKLGLGEDHNLYYLVGNLRCNKHDLYYNSRKVKNADGSERLISIPNKELREVQKAIDKNILRKFPRHSCSFGFMGGSCYTAASPHTGFQSLMTLDLRHAFSQVTHQRIFEALYSLDDTSKVFLSFYVARQVADLCTIGEIEMHDGPWVVAPYTTGGRLPEGAITSPRLFDICMTPLDDELSVLSRQFGLVYTRYADNLHVSSQENEFPKIPRAAVLSAVVKRFSFHKLRICNRGSLCRMLGLNVSPGMVSNTRDFKRSFRGALHHLRFVLDNELEHGQAWAVVQGYRGFAVVESLPEALLKEYGTLKQRVRILNYGF